MLLEIPKLNSLYVFINLSSLLIYLIQHHQVNQSIFNTDGKKVQSFKSNSDFITLFFIGVNQYFQIISNVGILLLNTNEFL
jgi:hypothetical protein